MLFINITILKINLLNFHGNVVEDVFEKENIFFDAICNLYKTNERNHFKEFTNKKHMFF